jgi:hypothetical protein
MSYRTVEASRELRLWITQVIVPISIAVVILVPEVRQVIADKARGVAKKTRYIIEP